MAPRTAAAAPALTGNVRLARVKGGRVGGGGGGGWGRNVGLTAVCASRWHLKTAGERTLCAVIDCSGEREGLSVALRSFARRDRHNEVHTTKVRSQGNSSCMHGGLGGGGDGKH